MKKKSIILASNSPRRKLLLEQIGINFIAKASNIKEDLNLDFPPEAMAEHWAREKAEIISKKFPNKLVIGADTIINFNNKIIGKPKDRLESFNILKKLSGNTHEVITGVCFLHINNKIDLTINEKTYVSLKKIEDKEINFYIKNFKPLDKAGSYGIQDFLAVNIKEIKGCYYNVMGLPLSSFYHCFNLIQKNC